jgi:cephalosporin-C deacetylase-like acetyl esterase
MKRILILIAILAISCTAISQNLLPEKWKFNTGDDASWSAPGFNDSGWKEIAPGSVWERQGYAGYDGYAWYRVTFTIPSKFRKDAETYGGLSLLLGKIDDVDFTYFNGKLIGKMGELPPDYITKYNENRNYPIAADQVLWDKPNTLAVRVFDLTGDGGIYGDPILLTVHGLADKVTIEPAFAEPDRVLKGSNDVTIPVSLKNSFNKPFKGVVTFRVVSDFGKDISSQEKEITLKANKDNKVTFMIPGIQPGFYKASVTFTSEKVTRKLNFMFGYEPEKIVSPPNPQPDFANYWSRAKRELEAVEPQFKLTKIDSLCTSRRNIYLVEMRSLGNILIRGWYSVPTAPGKHPAVMQVQGYSSTIVPEYVDYGDDIIGFGLNIRGHGNSKDDINPGFPGYLQYFLNDKELYIYRGAYMDCVRGVDFLFSRPEVDTTRVAVEGASQGGALTYATAALNNTRIRVCAPQVPFLSDFEDYFKVAVWPGNEFINYVEVEKKMTWEQVYNTLSYIDIKNLAGWIKAPMIMGVGLVDDVCPPHINFAAYNQVKPEKTYIVYPTSGHGLPEDFYKQKMAFIRSHFGLK